MRFRVLQMHTAQERTRYKLLKQGKMTQDYRDAIMIGVGIVLFGVLTSTCEVLIVCLLCNRSLPCAKRLSRSKTRVTTENNPAYGVVVGVVHDMPPSVTISSPTEEALYAEIPN
ncbi:hypothetical protein GBAR_LOCUS6100 [Geodia barretti]|uniref:Uncharacterized protein n=1 Tax=Geodia barretti TaxID=519541 RepID=A0AA35WBT8_GEOBA|nr:hypothetical protein GBAR_LOCUS6100 [Geodia barretti]